jgi:hypothetical protein
MPAAVVAVKVTVLLMLSSMETTLMLCPSSSEINRTVPDPICDRSDLTTACLRHRQFKMKRLVKPESAADIGSTP